jgi:DNA-binding SARP family transcriptional activator
MNTLRISLFGKLSIQRMQDGCAMDERPLIEVAKAQELLCFLLLHEDCPQPRERLAGVLWADLPPARARQYLRKALWQLQSALGESGARPAEAVLQVERNGVAVNALADCWVDARCFAGAFDVAEGVPGRELTPAMAEGLETAVGLYRGELLEGWYQDWCIGERERFEVMHLAALDKLMGYCEYRQEYERGIQYGLRLLGRDRARERSHRALMRLYYLAGDRTSALRQFQRCAAALEEELNAPPSPQTVALFERIRAGTGGPASAPEPPRVRPQVPRVDAELQSFALNLQQIEHAIHALRLQLAQHLETADTGRSR